MTPNPLPPTPAPVRRRWRWGCVVLLAVLVGLGALGWNRHTWQRAVRQLEEAGITADSQGDSVGENLWRAAQTNWRWFLDADTWTVLPTIWTMDPTKGANFRNLNALAPALRRINPELLDLDGCEALENLDGLKGLTALQLLVLNDCPALANAEAFKGLASLRSLNLMKCSALENVDGLKRLPALAWLDVTGCSALKSVENLKGLSALEHLDLTGCTKLSPEEVAALKATVPNADIIGP